MLTTILPRSPLPTVAEEQALGRRIRSGDRDARDELVTRNLPLLFRIASAFEGRGLAFDDLIGEGTLGLIRAVERFDPERGFRFSTYAGYWIKHTIRRALIDTTDAIRIPQHIWDTRSKMLAGKQAEESLSPARRRMLAQARQAAVMQHMATVGRGFDEDDRPEPSFDAFTGEDMPPEAPVLAAEERACLRAALGDLPELERFVVERRFGLLDGREWKLWEVGREIGRTKERVRQLEGQALERLRRALGGEGS